MDLSSTRRITVKVVTGPVEAKVSTKRQRWPQDWVAMNTLDSIEFNIVCRAGPDTMSTGT